MSTQIPGLPHIGWRQVNVIAVNPMSGPRLTYFTALLLLIVAPAFGQLEKGSLVLNYGYQWTSSYAGLFRSLACYEGCYPTVQRAIPLAALSVQVHQPFNKSKLALVIGVDVNSKGWEEQGMSNTGAGDWIEYKEVVTVSYVGALAGVGYELAAFKRYKIVVGQLLNPEVMINYHKDGVYKKNVLGTRTTASFQGRIGKSNTSFLMTPYFHTALMRYNKPDEFYGNPDFVPYGFGLSVGLAFKGTDNVGGE
jgi:hypothetical protein